MVTVGDQIQAWSGGQYKHVIGRPIYKEEKGISMAFLFAPTSSPSHVPPTLSLPHQALFALFLILLYNAFLYFLN